MEHGPPWYIMCSMHHLCIPARKEDGGGLYIRSRGTKEVATCKIDGAVINRYYAMCFFNINWSALMMLWKRAIVYSACIFRAPATDLPETSGLKRLQRRRKFYNEHCAIKVEESSVGKSGCSNFSKTEAISLFSCAFVLLENCKRFAWILLLSTEC
jgi:hypothetical protein